MENSSDDWEDYEYEEKSTWGRVVLDAVTILSVFLWIGWILWKIIAEGHFVPSVGNVL